jgi:hypothetical protein
MRTRPAAGLVILLVLAACAPAVWAGTGLSSSASSAPPPAPEREYRGQPTNAAPLEIPPGELPPPGQCRVWIPGYPAERQPAADRCSTLDHGIPGGALLLYRPASDRQHVHVSYFDEVRPDMIVAVRVYVAGSGRFVRDITP